MPLDPTGLCAINFLRRLSSRSGPPKLLDAPKLALRVLHGLSTALYFFDHCFASFSNGVVRLA